MKNQFSSNLRLGFGISMLLLLVSSIASYYTIDRLISSSGWVDHTNKVLRVSESILSFVKDGETGQRGYLLTGQQDFLEPYNGSYERAMTSIQEVKGLTTDNLSQQLNVDSLEILIRRRFAILAQSIEDKKANNDINIFLLRDGTATMQQIRLIVQKIQHIEETLLLDRTKVMKKFVSYAPVAIIFTTLLSLVITLIFFRRVMNDFREKSSLNESLRSKDLEMTRRISIIQGIAGKIANGDYSTRLNEEENDELGSLSISLNRMGRSLENNFNELNEKQWLQNGVALLSEKIAGEKTVEQLASDGIGFIASYTDSIVGAMYVSDTDNNLYVAGGYALPVALQNTRFKPQEGLPGQCLALRKEILLENVEESFYTTSASGTIKPPHLLLFPIIFEGSVTGVIELGSVIPFNQQHIKYLRSISEILGVTINTAFNRVRLKELLEETQAQSEELQAQHSELENINAELEVQAEKLQTSEEELKVQQEELMETNQELEERSRLLEEKNHMVVVRNLDIQKKAEELAQSTRYKSEFLANMSHELRTPLNSVLLLSRLLSENNQGNLNSEQIEYAQVIQSSGNGLLQLIDEILDLSKIESGKMELDYERVTIQGILENMRQLFAPMAKEKGLVFTLQVDEDVPGVIETDKLRVEQILKNLISNALKFTPAGSITLRISSTGNNQLAFAVKDTGIGIPEEKKDQVFEAFQQADGSTKRKYGGTGLGLSISRQLARLLVGDILLETVSGEGSVFTLIIPALKPVAVSKMPEKVADVKPVEKPISDEPVAERSPLLSSDIPETLPDDRDRLSEGDKLLLVVEDDTHFAKALLEFARQKQYKVIHSVRGDEVHGLVMKYKPMGILLDIQLPVKDGLSVMDELKQDPLTRHIPVHIMSSFEVRKESLSRGAVDFINKPVMFDQMNSVLEKIEQALTSDFKKVLIVEDNTYHAKALAYFLASNNVQSEIAGTVEASIETLQQGKVNCVILDMGASGKPAYETLDIVKKHSDLEQLPIIIFTGQNLSRTEEQRIRQYADTIVVKTANSYQRILNEVSLFLHLVDQPAEKKGKGLGTMDGVLKGKTVLIADDDVRNIFALTKALELHKMNIVTAIDGKDALEQLKKADKVDLVLMDMMMPEMDGYETITRIRKDAQYKRLPIIAVTAKAMTGDRDKCIQAGASDYISKPVDTDQLLSLIRVWLYENI